MICMAYCNDCGEVVGGGALIAPVMHTHIDTLEYQCTVVDNVPEAVPEYYPWKCGDGVTFVNDPGEWLSYLRVYK